MALLAAKLGSILASTSLGTLAVSSLARGIPSCLESAFTKRSSETKFISTRILPSRPPQRCCSARAAFSLNSSSPPARTRSSPSLIRAAIRLQQSRDQTLPRFSSRLPLPLLRADISCRRRSFEHLGGRRIELFGDHARRR